MPYTSLQYEGQEKVSNREKHKICLSISHEKINMISTLEISRFPIMSYFLEAAVYVNQAFSPYHLRKRQVRKS